MVKPLAFKGDKKSKKRKIPPGNSRDIHTRDVDMAVSKEATAEDDDSWVSADAATDIIGPVVFAVPSTPPACIACDANGKVFASDLENIVEGDLATAEPHDVRQVWVASRISGTENISFKGHHGRYVATCHYDKLHRERLLLQRSPVEPSLTRRCSLAI